MTKKFTASDLDACDGYAQDYNAFAADILGVDLDSDQKAILHSVQCNRRTIVKSGHARGKDYIAAVASLCFLYNNYPCKIISTAPTGRQVRNIMLAEAKRIWSNANERLAKQGKRLDGEFFVDSLRLDNDWFMLGFKAPDQEIEAWTGFHSENIGVFVTEASGVHDIAFQGIEGLLTGNSRLYLCLNPNRCQGEAYRAFASDLYEKFTLDCMNAPNVLARETLYPGQVDWMWVDEKVHKQGWTTPIAAEQARLDDGDFLWEGKWYRPSDLFRVKVRGMWPQESEDQLVPLAWIEAAQQRWLEWTAAGQKVPDDPIRLGVDVAGMGADMTVFCIRRGDCIPEMKAYTKSDHMGTAGQVKAMLDAHPDAKAFVDTIGEGAGVHSRLKEQKVASVSVKFSQGVKGLKDMTGERQFANMRAYCYWAVRDALDPKLGGKLMLPPNDELSQDLTEPNWTTNSSGKILLEPKDSIKARLSRSPDFGDALALTYYPRNVSAPRNMDMGGFGINS